MLFHSFDFAIFAPIVLIGHALLKGRALKIWMVIASYIFYGWAHPWYCLLLVFSTVLDFTVAQRIHASTVASTRKTWLLLSLGGNLGLLALFKYGGMFERWMSFAYQLLTGDLPSVSLPELALPVGISFYTFQTLSYTIDVYRKKMEPTKNFLSLALYVAFFPQLVAGPIERARHLLPQLEAKQSRTDDDVLRGITRVMWGLTKKVIFADWFGWWVAQIWTDPADATPWELFLALHAFSFQIYLDFSAYSDIAIGLARIMGIRLSENFRWPFMSRNPIEFWTRWHISLTTWVRDYLYIPLGGNRRGKLRSEFNGMLVMLVIGLWHGADEKFIVWGFLHWVYDALYRLYVRFFGSSWYKGKPYRWGDAPAILLTYFLVIPQVFFGAPTISDAFLILEGLTGIFGDFSWNQPMPDVLRIVVMVGIAMAVHVVRGLQLDEPLRRNPTWWKCGLLWGGLTVAMALLHAPDTSQFYYFQF